MTKFHMKRDGTPGVCTAEEGNCPLGGNENHVEAETLEQAQQYFDDKNESRAKETQKLSNTIKDLKDKYQKMYGPLTIFYPCNKWRWLEEPWPWERGNY